MEHKYPFFSESLSLYMSDYLRDIRAGWRMLLGESGGKVGGREGPSSVLSDQAD